MVPESIEVIGEFPHEIEDLESNWKDLVAWFAKSEAELRRIDHLHAFKFNVEDAAKAVCRQIGEAFPKLINSPVAVTMGFESYREAEEYLGALISQLMKTEVDPVGRHPLRLCDHPVKFSPLAYWKHLVQKFGGKKLADRAYETAAHTILDCCGGPSSYNGTHQKRQAGWPESFKEGKNHSDLEMRWMKLAWNIGNELLQKYDHSSLQKIHEVINAFQLVDQWWHNENSEHQVTNWISIQNQITDQSVVFRDGNGTAVRKVEFIDEQFIALLPYKEKMGLRLGKPFAAKVEEFVLKFSVRLNQKGEGF
jgi:hypothetical protein